MKCDRRRLLVGTAAFGVAAPSMVSCEKTASRAEGPTAPAPLRPNAATSVQATAAESHRASVTEIPRRPLGKTGVMVSAVGLGGYHVGKQKNESESIALIRSAIDRGIDFLDNCWDYNGGQSEERMGQALRDGYRQRAFLMTKLDGRTQGAAAAQLEQSLKRLQTDMIDLVQVHEVIRPDDPGRCFQAGGCIEALISAKKAGKLRFIGFTGHKDPDIHLAMLKAADEHGFAFDTVQMPLNVMDAHYRSFEKLVLPVALSKNMGILGMKALGGGIILQSKAVTAVECLRYALSLPTSVVITGCDSMSVLDQAVATASHFQPYNQQEIAALLSRTRAAAQHGAFEKFKTSHQFDGTHDNPKWLDTAEI